MTKNDEESYMGMGRKNRLYEEFEGEWVVIISLTGRNYAGLLQEPSEGHAILGPHQAGFYSAEGEYTAGIKEEGELRVNIMRGLESIQFTTRENIEGSCVNTNNANGEEALEKIAANGSTLEDDSQK